MILRILKTIRKRLTMFRFRRKPNPNWDEIHQLFKQAAIRQKRAEERQDRAEQRQDRTDQQLDRVARQQERNERQHERTERELERLAQEQKNLAREQKKLAQEQKRLTQEQKNLAQQQQERDQVWWAKQDALQAAREKQRAQDQAAWEKKRAQDQAVWEKQRAQDQAVWEKQRVRDQAAWDKKLVQYEAAREKQRAQDQAAWEKKRARDQAAWEKKHEKSVADHLAIVKQIQQEVGGAAHNLGNIAEEYFMQAWDNCEPVLIGDVEFDEVLANEKFRGHGKEMECDLVLLNSTHIGIVEVKLSLHPKDVRAFDAKLKKVLPLVLPAEYRHLHVMPVMACTGMTAQARKRIEEHGFALLRPAGQKAKLEIEHLRPRPPIDKPPDA